MTTEVVVGAKYQGKVTGITKFGAFVELLGPVTGLVHISEVADRYVTDIKEHLKVGDVVTVKVMTIKEGKIGLSIKQVVDKPASAQGAEQPFNRPNKPFNRGERSGRTANYRDRAPSFEDKLSRFLKDSEDHLGALGKPVEKKRRDR